MCTLPRLYTTYATKAANHTSGAISTNGMFRFTPSTAPPQLSRSRSSSDSYTAGGLSTKALDTDEQSLPPFPRYSTTAQSPVLLSNLPIELLDRILDFCDNSLSLRLAQVNRLLNLCATEALLSRELSRWHLGEIRIPHDHAYEAQFQILAALNMRQLDMHTLKCIDYTFYAERWCNQVDAMTRFVRDHVKSIDRMSLLFYSKLYEDVSEALVYRSKVILLLEAALEKGCQRFYLGGHLPAFERYQNDPIVVPLTPRGKQFRMRCERWLKKSYASQQTLPPLRRPPLILFPRPRIPTPSFAWQSRLSFMTGSPSLTELEIESPLMLTRSLLPHTFNLLRNQSPVLRKLKIHDWGQDFTEFFSTITLPVLENFGYMSFSMSPELFDLLLLFLVRHPDIQTVCFPLKWERLDEGYSTFDTNTFLPSLKTLRVHAKTFAWLLRDPNAFLNLERVSIKVANWHTARLYDDVEAALVALSSRMDNTTSDRKGPTHLKFKFCVDDRFFSWLSSHITKPCASHVRHLKGVETLTISLKDAYATLEPRHLDDLITWSGLFPNVRRLRLDGCFGDRVYEAGKAEGFVTNLKKICPRLEKYSIRKRAQRWFEVEL